MKNIINQNCRVAGEGWTLYMFPSIIALINAAISLFSLKLYFSICYISSSDYNADGGTIQIWRGYKLSYREEASTDILVHVGLWRCSREKSPLHKFLYLGLYYDTPPILDS